MTNKMITEGYLLKLICLGPVCLVRCTLIHRATVGTSAMIGEMLEADKKIPPVL